MKENSLTIVIPPETPPEFAALVQRCYVENPDKKDLAELRRRLRDEPELYSAVFDMAEVVRDHLIDMVSTGSEPASLGIGANVAQLKEMMGYEQSPQVEKLLIDQVIDEWIFLKWAEMKYAHTVSGGHTADSGQYWLQVVGATQRRYLRAIETLARVRKITRATLQINIATDGAQQVNIAGDHVAKKR